MPAPVLLLCTIYLCTILSTDARHTPLLKQPLLPSTSTIGDHRICDQTRTTALYVHSSHRNSKFSHLNRKKQPLPCFFSAADERSLYHAKEPRRSKSQSPLESRSVQIWPTRSSHILQMRHHCCTPAISGGKLTSHRRPQLFTTSKPITAEHLCIMLLPSSSSDPRKKTHLSSMPQCCPNRQLPSPLVVRRSHGKPISSSAFIDPGRKPICNRRPPCHRRSSSWPSKQPPFMGLQPPRQYCAVISTAMILPDDQTIHPNISRPASCSPSRCYFRFEAKKSPNIFCNSSRSPALRGIWRLLAHLMCVEPMTFSPTDGWV
ncbi:hypothetical protein ACLOJK_036821 [Asimina triloba]